MAAACADVCEEVDEGEEAGGEEVNANEWPDYEKWAYIKGYIYAIMAIECFRRSEIHVDDMRELVLMRLRLGLSERHISLKGDDWGRAGRIAGHKWFLMTTDDAGLFEAQIAGAL